MRPSNVYGQMSLFNAQGMAIKIDCAGIGKSQQRQWLVAHPGRIKRAFRMLVHQTAGTKNIIDGVARHLRSRGEKLFAQLFVGKVVQGDPVPAARLLHHRRQRVAHLCKSSWVPFKVICNKKLIKETYCDCFLYGFFNFCMP